VGESVVERGPDEVAVQAGRQPDAVLVPVQDVERGRVLAEQVVVDEVVPDQVVGTQPREHARHVLARQHALLARTLDRIGDDFFSHSFGFAVLCQSGTYDLEVDG